MFENLVPIILNNYTLSHSVKLINQTLNQKMLSNFIKHSVITKGHNYTKSQDFKEHRTMITYILQLADGKIATGSTDGFINIWEATKTKLFKVIFSLKEHDGAINLLFQLKDGKLISRCAFGKFNFWNIRRDYMLIQSMYTVNCYSIKELEGGVLAIQNGNSVIKLFKNVRFHKPMIIAKTIKRSGGFSVFIQIKDKRIVTASGDGVIRMFDPVEYKCIKVMKGHVNKVTCLLELKDGNLLSAGHSDIRLWNSKDKFQFIMSVKSATEVYKAFEIKYNKIMVVGNRVIEMFEYSNNSLTNVLTIHTELIGLNIHMLPDERIVALTSNRVLCVFDPRKNYAITFKRDNSYLLTLMKYNIIATCDNVGNLFIIS
jgi:WD40 repeat protein